MTKPEQSKRNVLIVEDDPFMQSLYRMVLEREGFTILTAEDGLATIEMLPRMSVDLIVLDLMLPKISGLEVLEAIRADSRHNSVPVIILSNAYLPGVARMAAKAGATEGLLKSEFSPKRLVKLINQLLTPSTLPSNPTAEPRNSWISGLMGKKTETPAMIPSQTPIALTVDERAVASEVHAELMKTWPTDIWLIRQDSLKYQKTAGTQESEELLKRIYSKLRLFSARATMAGCGKVSQLCIAFEAMLFEHGFNLKRSEFPSLFQTMAQAMDCLEYLFKSGRTMTTQAPRKNRILLVDDDAVCNTANSMVLARANFDTVCASDGASALALLEAGAFDLILLDVNMPGLNGFQVCSKIRELPQYKQIPVIFVSLYNDFQSRTQSVLCGSNGFISKPISPIELIVKALVFLFRTQNKEAYRDEPLAIATAVEGLGAKSVTMGALAEAPKSMASEPQLPAPQASVGGGIDAVSEPRSAQPDRLARIGPEAAELAKPQSELEPALTQRSPVQEPVAGERAQPTPQVETELKVPQLEPIKPAILAKELEPTQSALSEVQRQLDRAKAQVQSLTESLSTESGRRANAERQAAELAARRTQLEAKLAQGSQVQEQLETQLAGEQQRIQAVTLELDGFRSRASADSLRQQRLFELLNLSELARVQLGTELRTARELASSLRTTMRALKHELQQRRGAPERLGIQLQVEGVKRRRCETRVESTPTPLDEGGSQADRQCVPEPNGRGGQSEEANGNRNLPVEIAQPNTSVASQAEASKHSRSQVPEVQGLPSWSAKAPALTELARVS